ncbi:MAG: hypothetical protein QM817_06265 [Archangium sp.]
MVLTSLLIAQVLAADPCEQPRMRDTNPLVAAIAQDKVMAQTFVKAAGACVEPGESCNAARLECATLLTSTIQKQVAFDEGQWLRDMLLPYLGSSYPMTRTFGAAALATDGSCNVEVAVLQSAGQKRSAQAIRRDNLLQEYQLYAKWAQTQLQRCKERATANDAANATARAEAERLAAQNAAVAQAAAMKAEQEKKAREAAEAEAKRVQAEKDAVLIAAKKKEDDEKLAKENAAKAEEQRRKDAMAMEDQRRKDAMDAEDRRRQDMKDAEAARAKQQEEMYKRQQAEKEEAARAAKEAEAQKFVSDRDQKVAMQKELKERTIKEAEDNFKRAKDEEALKKQAAVDAVSSSPAIAQAAVAEAAQAEKTRIDAEKKLYEARQRADAIVIDTSYERGGGSILAAGGGSALDTGFGLGVMIAAQFGFWGTPPAQGMASGLELRLWGRYMGVISGTPSRALDTLVTARYYFGMVGLGLAGELRVLDPNFAAIRGGAGASVALAFIDNHETRVVLGVNYMPVGNVIDAARVFGDFEVGWRWLSFHVNGGLASRVDATSGATMVGWQVGAYGGARLPW